MKQTKKILSVILSILMIMSVTTVGLSALAADKTAAVTAFEEKANAFDIKTVNKADPTEDELAAYEELVAAFKALSQEEKDSADVFAFDNTYGAVLNREYQLEKAKGTSSTNSWKAAAAKIAEVLGSLPSYIDEAIALVGVLDNSKATADEKLEAFANANESARFLKGCWHKSYKCFYYRLNKNGSGSYEMTAFKNVVDALFNEINKANPNPETMKKPTPPSYRDYPLGRDDPEYKKAYEEYEAQMRVYNTWYVGDYNYKGEQYIEAYRKIAEAAPEYVALVDVAILARDAKKAFDETGDATKAPEAVKAYEALTDVQKTLFSGLGQTLYAIITKTSNTWGSTTFKAPALLSACRDIENVKFVNEFVDLVNSIEEPYTRADIDAVKASRALVPSSLTGSIPAEVDAKYKDILASIGPDEATEVPSLDGLPKTNVEYSKNAKKEDVATSVSELEKTVLMALGISKAELPEYVANAVYTNDNVAKIIGFLCPTLGGLSNLIAKMPADLAKSLTEEKFAGAVEVLNAADASLGQDAWKTVEFKNGDMGFKDGDREGFLDACAAIFRPFSLITMALTLENSISTSAGTYTYNGYEKLVPVFEALDLRGVVSSHDYTLAVNAAPSANDKMDARIRPILVPVVNLIDDLAKDPLNTVLDLLPKLGYTLSSGILNDQINAILASLKFVSIDPVDLTTEGLFNIIAPKLENIAINDETTVSIKLDKARFVKFMNEIAGCGEYVLKDSVARGMKKYVTIKADRADAYVVTFSYLHDVITTRDNVNAIKTVVGTFVTDESLKTIIDAVITLATSNTPGMAITAVTNALPFVRLITQVITLVKMIFEKIKEFFSIFTK